MKTLIIIAALVLLVIVILLVYRFFFSRAVEGVEIPGVGFIRGNWHEGDE